MDIKDYNSQETLIEEKPSSLEEDFNNQSDNVSADVGCEKKRTLNLKVIKLKKNNSNSKDEEHLPEQQEMIQEKKKT